MKVLRQSSLVFWLVCYICGLFLAFLPMDSLFVCLLLLLVSLLAMFRSNFLPVWNAYFLYAPLFAILGLFSMEGVLPQQNNELIEGENYYIGQIEQRITDNKLWNSHIVRLKRRLNDGTKWEIIDDRVLLLIENLAKDGEAGFNKNSIILFRGRFEEILRFNNPGEFNSQIYWYSKGVRYQGFGSHRDTRLLKNIPLHSFDRLLETVRNYSSSILDTWIGLKDSPLLKALLLGDKSDLDSDTKRIFMNTGAMHMLAVSGMHVGLIVLILEQSFKYLFLYRGKQTASVIIVIILWFYAFLTGFSASVTRAVVMFTVLILTRLFRRTYLPINSLSIAAFFILLWNPLALFDIGFQLSFLAMLGIFTIYPLLQNSFTISYSWVNTLWQGTAVGLAAQVFTFPLSLYYFHQFPNYFILTNIGVMLCSGLLLGLALALLVVGKIPIISAIIGWILAFLASLFVGFIAFIETLPGALSLGFNTSWSWVLLTYSVIFLSLYWLEKKQWIRSIILFVPILIWVQVERTTNLVKKEWIVFNSDNTVVLFNHAGEQVCLYENHPKAHKQAQRVVADYQKIHPGKVDFYPIVASKYTIKMGKQTFQVLFDNNKTTIKTPVQDYTFFTSKKLKTSSKDPKIQELMEKIRAEHKTHLRKTGAYRYTF